MANIRLTLAMIREVVFERLCLGSSFKLKVDNESVTLARRKGPGFITYREQKGEAGRRRKLNLPNLHRLDYRGPKRLPRNLAWQNPG